MERGREFGGHLMPFQWRNGTKPPGVKTSKVLVIGPDEFYDSDYPLLKKVLDEVSAWMEDVRVVVLGDGLLHRVVNRQKVFYGVDRQALRWADHYKWSRVLVPEHRYASLTKRNADLKGVLGTGSFCVWFRDDSSDRGRNKWLYDNLLRDVITPKRTKIIKV